MVRSAEAAEREATIAELKRLLTAGHYTTQEMLEEAVDALLWSEHDRQQAEQAVPCEVVRSHPK
jgi:hypothetical protein